MLSHIKIPLERPYKISVESVTFVPSGENVVWRFEIYGNYGDNYVHSGIETSFIRLMHKAWSNKWLTHVAFERHEDCDILMSLIAHKQWLWYTRRYFCLLSLSTQNKSSFGTDIGWRRHELFTLKLEERSKFLSFMKSWHSWCLCWV